jgi:hypothetical protein
MEKIVKLVCANFECGEVEYHKIFIESSKFDATFADMDTELMCDKCWSILMGEMN